MTRTLAFVAVLLAVGWATRGALDVAFLQDDFHVTQVLGPEMRLDGETAWRLVHPPPEERDSRLRPVPYLSLLFDIHWFGIDPRLLHLAGWLLHLVATALVAALVAAVWPGRPALAWIAALLFGIHGAHADAIGWLAARADPCVGVATLATALAYARFRTTGAPIAAALGIVCAGLALGSKEAGAVVIALVGVVEVAFRLRGAPAPSRRVGGAFAALAAITVGYFLYRRHLFGVFLGSYGSEDAAALRVGTEALGVFARNLVAPYGDLAREAIAPTVVFVGAALAARHPSLRRRIAVAVLLAVGIVIAIAPVVPFLDRTHGRHYYLAVVPWAILLAAAVRAWWTRHAALGAIACVAVVATSYVGLQAKMSDYVEAGAITQAIRRDLAAIRDEHPDVGLVAVGGLVSSWQRAPLFFAGFDFLARPPFTDPAVPVASYRAVDRRDRRWEAYVERRKPMLFCELVATDASGRPGLERRSPLITDLPPRVPSPGYATDAPVGGRSVTASSLAFDFTVPADPWPRPLRIVIDSAAGTFPLLVRERHLRAISTRHGLRRLQWDPALGVDSDDDVATRIEAMVTEPVPIRWWVEEADLDLDRVRAAPSSAEARAVLVPR